MNLLDQETSPYLRQHKDNPVHWMPWGAAAFDRARSENKPILLSIGYAACHWCHVMARESFEDPATADLMNARYVNIKVDREELPDVDAIYQHALALMGQQGGWPLTIFLTPEGHAFWGGTYFPPHGRHGLPAFREVLRGVADACLHEKEKIGHNTQSIARALGALHTAAPSALPLLSQADVIGNGFLQRYDPLYGGFGAAEGPKFPCLPALSLLWDCYIRTGHDKFKAAVVHSLTSICQGGIYDHIDGGFFRYSVDGEWQIPHFEKMLSDNAQMIALLTEVYRETQQPIFAARIAETVDWLSRVMPAPQNGIIAYAASMDADSVDENGLHEEGAYYIWRAGDIDHLLGGDAEEFRSAYEITRFGNWPGKQGFNIPARLHAPEWRGDAEEAKLNALCRKLRFDRARRAPPARDDKVLCDWNALLAAALAKAAFVFNRPEWRGMAVTIFEFIDHFLTGEDGRLYHSWCGGKRGAAGRLDDYAHYIAAALSLHETASDDLYLDKAIKAAQTALDIFAHSSGGLYMSPAENNLLPLRPLHADDSAQPSGNGAMAMALQTLYMLTGDRQWHASANKIAAAFSGDALHNLFPRASVIRAAFLLQAPLSVVIDGTDDAARDGMAGVLKTLSVPGISVFYGRGSDLLPPSHPAYGKKAAAPAAAWLCAGMRCLPPVTSTKTFREMLRAERGGNHRPPANDE